LDGKKVEQLRWITAGEASVEIFEGDCNTILRDSVFKQVRYDRYERALCLLDPYGLHLDWHVIREAGQSQAIDMFLNFPIMDINRNAIWRNPDNVPPNGIMRMTRFWGDESWRDVAYKQERTLFGIWPVKTDNAQIVTAFRQRLKDVAGFAYVPEPLAMKNNVGAEVYYLFFASHNRSADKIVRSILKRYR
jgi:three-Cys-motif partner protein